MLIGQNQPSAEQSAAVVDETVVDGGEHVYVQVGKFQLEKAHAAFVGFVEIDAFAFRDHVPSGTFILLAFLVA